MIVIENTTLYKCEHCNKKYYRKQDIVRHELFCKKTPVNQHKCFEFCKHLIREVEQIQVSEWDIHRGFRSSTSFKCEKTGEYMYSFIAEKKGLLKNGYISEDTVRMPKECELYEIISDECNATIQP